MNAEACTFALRNALTEIRNVYPDVSSTFIFKENGEIITDQDTNSVAVGKAQGAFRALSDKANILGDVESVIFNGASKKATITKVQEFYVANVASTDVDEKTVTNLTRVMIPTMLRLVQEMYPSRAGVHEAPQETAPEHLSSPEIPIAEPQTSQFTVEILGFPALLNDPKVAFIDGALIAQWSEAYGNFSRISLENPVTGKSLVCGFKPFGDSKFEGRSVVQLSDKARVALGIQKGAQILVKPVVGQSNQTEPDLESSGQSTKEPESVSAKSGLTAAESCSFDTAVNQFIVEDVGGFVGRLGTAEYPRLDSGILARWKELFGDREIKQIIVEGTTTGRKVTSKFKILKGSEFEGKGIIQLPEKIQSALQTMKGGLVVVKPVVED